MKHFFKIVTIVLMLATQVAMAQWSQTGGPPGMNINTFYQFGNTLFTGTSAKGVFKSMDAGVTWSPANSGIENLDVFAIISTGKFLFAGTTNGVYRSVDNGSTWTAANSGIEGKFVISFLNANGYLFAGTTGSGLYRSRDHGNSWQDANGNALNSSSILAITFSNDNLVVVADDEIFYSKSNGNAWLFNFTSPFIFNPHTSFVTKGDSVMVTNLSGVVRSFDGGNSWGSLIEIDPDITICGTAMIGNQVFVGSPTGVFRSTDFGETWSAVPETGLRIGQRFTNTFYSNGKNLYIGADEVGVAYSTNSGRNWKYTLKGFSPASTIDNALLGSDTLLISGTHTDGLYHSDDNGATWVKYGTKSPVDSFSNAIVFSVLRSSGAIFAGTCGYGLYRSGDNGQTWIHITNGLPKDQTGFSCINSLAQANNNRILAGTVLGLYYSDDGGLSWKASNLKGDGFNIEGVAANGSTACAGVEGQIYSNQIYRSTDNGATWKSVFSGIVDWTCMASDGVNHFYAGTFTGSYVSNDNGQSWQSFGSGIPVGDGAFAIGVLGNNVFVGNEDGVFFSNNNAASFTNRNEGFTDDFETHSVQGFGFSSTYVFAGLFNNAVWKRPLSDFITAARMDNEANPIRAWIAPNPVYNNSVLNYHLDQSAFVQISIYDFLGRKIKALKNETNATGDYQVTISDLPTGNYVAVILAGEKQQSVKFEVIR